MFNKQYATILALAEKHFGLKPPFNKEVLKKAFRNAAKSLHTDVAGETANDELFSEMKRTYDSIHELSKSLNRIFSNGESKEPITTIDGTHLWELGLGLGPTVNGRDCEECEHQGYLKRFGKQKEYCTNCDDNGIVPREFPCRVCSGSGKFTQARTKRVVDCRVCKGSGIFKHSHQKQWCPECSGTKMRLVESEIEVYFEKCTRCSGTGEIKIYNPVIPKGRLFAGQ
jgi:DnaJ-class molecular chaperone